MYHIDQLFRCPSGLFRVTSIPTLLSLIKEVQLAWSLFQPTVVYVKNIYDWESFIVPHMNPLGSYTKQLGLRFSINESDQVVLHYKHYPSVVSSYSSMFIF